MADQTQACPLCGETIPALATLCRFCGAQIAGVPSRRRRRVVVSLGVAKSLLPSEVYSHCDLCLLSPVAIRRLTYPRYPAQLKHYAQPSSFLRLKSWMPFSTTRTGGRGVITGV